ncbi:MAG: trigger factor [Clostridia bacterium]
MSMKFEKTDKNNELKLSFIIEAEKFDEAIKKVYAKNAKYFNIPGFRKGKAPMNIVEKHYGSEIFYEDAFNELVPEIFEQELKDNHIEAVSRPDIDITQIEKGKELIFTAIIQTRPEIKLGKYKGIELKKVEYTVKDEDIQHELGHMQEKNARLVNVEDKPVENGDTTIIDFEGFVDGVAFEGGKAENHELVIGSNTFIPGFEDQIIGMKIDEEKDIKVTFPEEYFSKDLAGKEATFKVKLHEIKKKELPTLDDEFAKDVSEFDTLKELKDSIKEKLEKENESKAKYETEEAAIKKVCEEVEVEIPSGMIETETDNMVKDIEQRLSYQGLALTQYLQMMNKTEADMRKEFEEQATNSVKTRLVLDAVIVAEKIEASEDEIKEKVEEMAKNYGRDAKELMENENLKNYIADSVKTEKAISFIVDNAKIK